MYQVKNIKTFQGHDGGCWECTLYSPQNKRVAIVTEDGWGGGLQFHWLDFKAPKVEVTSYDYADKPHTYKGTPQEAALYAFCRALPNWHSEYDDDENGKPTSPDVYLDELVNKKLTEKDVKRLINKKVAVFNEGSIYTWKCPITHPEIRGLIKDKYPKGIIINDLPLTKAVELYQQYQGCG